MLILMDMSDDVEERDLVSLHGAATEVPECRETPATRIAASRFTSNLLHAWSRTTRLASQHPEIFVEILRLCGLVLATKGFPSLQKLSHHWAERLTKD
jgi:hypothetical protein